jgi:uncharacterized membrane protein (UPF0127 family)
MIRALFLAVAGTILTAVTTPGIAAPPASPGETAPVETSTAVVVTKSGGRFLFNVELARTSDQRAQGLQGRTSLAADAGMLFDFEAAQPVAMWMKNTLIPLDMVFIGTGGVIVHVARNTQPLSLKLIESPAPVRGVMELPAGTTARLGIRPGDRVEHDIFR